MPSSVCVVHLCSGGERSLNHLVQVWLACGRSEVESWFPVGASPRVRQVGCRVRHADRYGGKQAGIASLTKFVLRVRGRPCPSL